MIVLRRAPTGGDRSKQIPCWDETETDSDSDSGTLASSQLLKGQAPRLIRCRPKGKGNKMRIRNLILIAALVALATPALATVKVYDASVENGTGGSSISYSTTLCPPVTASPGKIQGAHTLEDAGGGTVSMNDFFLIDLVYTNYVPPTLDGVFGPGSFVFITASPTIQNQSLPQTGTGSTAPSGSVAWGVVSGFTNTGVAFCISSPQTICTGGAMVAHGVTAPLGAINSTTYDLGTWSFDAVGDLSATQYINRTSNGGTSNGQRLITGSYVGSSIPALPLIGAGALALGLVVAGTRTVMRKK